MSATDTALFSMATMTISALNLASVQQMDSVIDEWEYRVKLSHATQVEVFGWCICEDTDGEGQMGEGCPV